jgi:SsrA-binding protein
MARPKEKEKDDNPVIAQNRKAWHDYFIEEKLEAGLSLQGWEVKSLRAGRAQLKEAYVMVNRGEVFLVGSHFSPLTSTSTHNTANPTRARKLLLHAEEIQQLIGAVERKGYALIPLELYWKRGRAKLQIALARGKKSHEKREHIKKKESDRDMQRALRARSK